VPLPSPPPTRLRGRGSSSRSPAPAGPAAASTAVTEPRADQGGRKRGGLDSSPFGECKHADCNNNKMCTVGNRSHAHKADFVPEAIYMYIYIYIWVWSWIHPSPGSGPARELRQGGWCSGLRCDPGSFRASSSLSRVFESLSKVPSDWGLKGRRCHEGRDLKPQFLLESRFNKYFSFKFLKVPYFFP
jgi:hypothetical protein